MSHKKTMSITAVGLLCLFCVFVVIYERHVQQDARQRIASHADIIAEALWHLEPKGSAAYLNLACKTHKYQYLEVRDIGGTVFQKVNGVPPEPLDRLLLRLNLIQKIPLTSDIVHGRQVIGSIEALWRCDAVYMELLGLFALIFVYVVLQLYFSLLRSKQNLEFRVEMRTEAITEINEFLQKEIKEHREARKALEKSETRYRAYFEDNIAGAYISTPAGQLIACNKEYNNIFGFQDSREAVDYTIAKTYKDPRDRTVFLDILQKKKRITGYETRYQKKDGTLIHLLENASGVFDDAGNLTTIKGFLMDITQQKKLKEQLLQARKMESIGTMAGGIAHDFNNLLSPIIGHSEMILANTASENPWRKNLDAIRNSALRARDLVQQILTFSRRRKGEMKWMTVQPIIKEVFRLISPVVPDTIELQQEIDSDCRGIKGDPTQVHQIIMNLMTNACHAMETTGGILTVSFKENALDTGDQTLSPEPTTGDWACLTVTDTGEGMDTEVLERIFEPFFTTRKTGKGTGMGLSVVHGIVKDMGGTMQVESTPGLGTRFAVYLPVADTPREMKPPPIDGDIIPGGRETLLVVDDEAAVLEMVSEMLTRLGYQVEAFTDGTRALEAFTADPEKFDLLLSDLEMPGISGTDLVEQVRAFRAHLPVILCTGFGKFKAPEKNDNKDAQHKHHLLMKPIEMKDLSQTIRQALNKPGSDPTTKGEHRKLRY